MVQMKETCQRLASFMPSDFISHMVQMKELGENKKEKFHIKLYIPHGSDESCSNI